MPRGESTFLSSIMGNTTTKPPIITEVLEHEHPLHLSDLQPDYPHYEEEYEEDDSDSDADDDDLITQQNFRCRRCDRCSQEITWFHRYYYKCAHSCDYSLHKFCGELPLTLKHSSHPDHNLSLTIADRAPDSDVVLQSPCVLCDKNDNLGLGYVCLKCDFRIHFNCAMASVDDRMIYHPSHRHPLAPILKPLLSDCSACGKEHKGIFYVCTTCFGIFIHSDCAFLPKKFMIQNATDGVFSHPHPLILSYSFPQKDQIAKNHPRCRVCNTSDYGEKTWIFTCEKCRYYAHIHCATRGPGKRLLIKNYDDSNYPDLLHLPFPDESYSIQKHLFSKLVEHGTFRADEGNLKHKFHPHPLILVRAERNDATSTPTSSKTNVLSCHNPMKKVQLLCNACVRPITSVPFYKCVNDNCNFVLHEWCTQLPTQVEEYLGHPEHTLILYSNAPNKILSVFYCPACELQCNGFVYSCVQCDYHIDVTCSFIPHNIMHEAHIGHLLSRSFETEYDSTCLMCRRYIFSYQRSFNCHTCGVGVHVGCALLLPSEIRHKYDKHPMRLNYLPIENHKSDYFCEICENELNPERSFYHCHECAQSVHTACAPHILQSETSTSTDKYYIRGGPYYFMNIKFGGIHKFKYHSHALAFVQGIESDGPCTECGVAVEYKLILKCQQCKFVIDLSCCQVNWRIDEVVEIHPLVGLI